MRRFSATASLWMASALNFVAVVALLGFLGWRTFIGGSEALPAITPLKVAAIEYPAAATQTAIRNPFDPSGTHWQQTRTDPAPESASSALSGVVVLPGVRVAITDGGIVKPGEALAGGKFRGIHGDRLSVETVAGRMEKIEGPGVSRPYLKDINQAGKTRDRATGEGKS